MTARDAGREGAARQCATCAGTGRIYSHNSWFVSDRFYGQRCGICGGSGKSDYRNDPDYVRFQKAARACIEIWGANRPSTDRQISLGLDICNARSASRALDAAIAAARAEGRQP
jgi:hypothetical protein